MRRRRDTCMCQLAFKSDQLLQYMYIKSMQSKYTQITSSFTVLQPTPHPILSLNTECTYPSPPHPLSSHISLFTHHPSPHTLPLIIPLPHTHHLHFSVLSPSHACITLYIPPPHIIIPHLLIILTVHHNHLNLRTLRVATS